MDNVITAAIVIAAAIVWLYTCRRASQDPRLSEQARRVASLAIFLSPWLTLVYWLPAIGGGAPFWADQDEPAGLDEVPQG